MKFFKITLVFVFFLSFHLFSQDIEIIELHSPDEDEKQNETQKEESTMKKWKLNNLDETEIER